MYMKSHRFASLLWTVTILLSLSAFTARAAEDDDLPLPQNGMEEEVTPGLQEEASPEPQPSLGDDALPEPSMGGPQEKLGNQVNPAPENDEIFLPAPAGQESLNYAPYTAGNVPVSRSSESEWATGMENRPIFSLHAGLGVVNYPNEAVEPNIGATTVGGSIRVFNISQTVFLHAYGAMSWATIGNLNSAENITVFRNVKDRIIHVGGLLEIGIGRRLSLFGSLLRRSHTLVSDADTTGQYGNAENFASDLVNEGIKLGVGLQYDFYVIPHGSLGLRGHLEQDMATVTLTMALEPAPRKRLSLNFDESP